MRTSQYAYLERSVFSRYHPSMEYRISLTESAKKDIAHFETYEQRVNRSPGSSLT